MRPLEDTSPPEIIDPDGPGSAPEEDYAVETEEGSFEYLGDDVPDPTDFPPAESFRDSLEP